MSEEVIREIRAKTKEKIQKSQFIYEEDEEKEENDLSNGKKNIEIIDILKKLLIEERRKRIEEREKANLFVKVTMEMKKDYEQKLMEQHEKMQKMSIPSSPAKKNERKSLSFTSKKNKISMPDYLSKVNLIAELQDRIEEKNMLNECQYNSIETKENIIRRNEEELNEKNEEIQLMKEKNKEFQEKIKKLEIEKRRLEKKLKISLEIL